MSRPLSVMAMAMVAVAPLLLGSCGQKGPLVPATPAVSSERTAVPGPAPAASMPSR